MKTALVKDNTYRLAKLSPMEQFHVARRISPLLAGVSGLISSAFSEAAPKEGEESTANLGQIFESAIQPLAEALSQLSDADCEYVISTCLARCYRLDAKSGQYAPVLAPGADSIAFMFSDMDFTVMMMLVVETIKAELASFF